MRGVVLLASIAFGPWRLKTTRACDSGILPCTRSPRYRCCRRDKDSWGPDECKNDRDGTVDYDERLRITGIKPGLYDVKLTRSSQSKKSN